ncbi:hypothetical protein A2U01_0041012, partial [Trifolium medium]|nr:hypothetical protein [Trifolium medium]
GGSIGIYSYCLESSSPSKAIAVFRVKRKRWLKSMTVVL